MELPKQNRTQTTSLLGKLLEKHLNPNKDPRIYVSKEVTFDYSTQHCIRVDYIQFKPENNTIGGIERGLFYCYEIKSCKEDFNSGHGLNFIGDYNYIVFPSLEIYEECKNKIPHYVGIYIINENSGYCDLKNIKKAKKVTRKYSVSEMLLMMFRSTNREILKLSSKCGETYEKL